MNLVACLNYYTKLNPGATWSISETYESLNWLSADIAKPTFEQLESYMPFVNIELFKNNIDIKVAKLLNETAKNRGYSDSQSVLSYLLSSNAQWKLEAETFSNWRDQIWEHVYIEYMSIDVGGSIPDEDQFIATLPQIVWPQGA